MKRSRPKRNLHAGLACSPALQHRNATQPPFQVAAINHKPEYSSLRSLFLFHFHRLAVLVLPTSSISRSIQVFFLLLTNRYPYFASTHHEPRVVSSLPDDDLSPVWITSPSKVLLCSSIETIGSICHFDFNTLHCFCFVFDHLFADLPASLRAFPTPKRPDQSLS